MVYGCVILFTLATATVFACVPPNEENWLAAVVPFLIAIFLINALVAPPWVNPTEALTPVLRDASLAWSTQFVELLIKNPREADDAPVAALRLETQSRKTQLVDVESNVKPLYCAALPVLVLPKE